MAITLNELEARIQPLLRDRTSGTVESSDIKRSANRQIRILRQRYGIHSLRNKAVLEVYPYIYEYAAETDFYDPINIQRRSGVSLDFDRVTPAEFWKYRNYTDMKLAVTARLGTTFLLVDYDKASEFKRIHALNDLTENGTWSAAASTDATNLTEDGRIFTQGNSSINFDIDVSASVNNYAAIENSDFTSVDLSGFVNNGKLFVDVFLPDSSNITGITLRWGSDASNYWEGSTTTQQNGLSPEDGWNTFGVLWEDATETGTVDEENIDYAYVQIDYSASQTDETDIRVDNLRIANATAFDIDYYSTYAVQASDGTRKTDLEDGDDSTIFEEIIDDYIMYKVLSEAFAQRSLDNDEAKANQRAEQALGVALGRHMSDRKREKRRYY